MEGRTYQLPVGHLRSFRRVQEPPGSSANSGSADVATNSEVPEEQPSGDEGFVSSAGRLLHDVQVGGVETEGSGGQTVSHQVDPQQLDGDQGFRQTEGSSQENTEKQRRF